MVTQANIDPVATNTVSSVKTTTPQQQVTKTPHDSFVWRAFLLGKRTQVKRT